MAPSRVIAAPLMLDQTAFQIICRANVVSPGFSSQNVNPGHGQKALGWVGLEPTTNALKGRCSTIELPTRSICFIRAAPDWQPTPNAFGAALPLSYQPARNDVFNPLLQPSQELRPNFIRDVVILSGSEGSHEGPIPSGHAEQSFERSLASARADKFYKNAMRSRSEFVARSSLKTCKPIAAAGSQSLTGSSPT